MDKTEIIISVLKTRLMFREDLNCNQKHGYGLALQEIEKEVKSQLKPQEGERPEELKPICKVCGYFYCKCKTLHPQRDNQ